MEGSVGTSEENANPFQNGEIRFLVFWLFEGG